MTNKHLPEDILLAYGAGSLTQAQSLVAAVHLSFCAQCRADLALLEEVGGLLLEGLPTAPGAPLPAPPADLDAPAPAPTAVPTIGQGVDNPRLPGPVREALALAGVRGWRMVIPGMVYQIRLPGAPGEPPARLTWVRKGFQVPKHTHQGLELGVVLVGGYSDDSGEYGVGDIAENDEHVSHVLQIDPDEDCILLTANDTQLQFISPLHRFLARFLGFEAD